MKSRYVYLLGPAGCGCKSVCGFAQTALGDQISVIRMSEVVRAMRKSDPPFEQAFGQMVDSGLRIPDPVVTQMFNAALNLAAEPYVLIEGFPKTLNQVEWAYRREVLTRESTVVILRARKDVCWARYNKAHPSLYQKATRFDHHYDEFERQLRFLQSEIRKTGSQIISLDANRVIKTEIMSMILPILQDKFPGIALDQGNAVAAEPQEKASISAAMSQAITA